LGRRQGVQIGEIVAAALAHAAGGGARQGVKADGPERLAADPAKPRHLLHICAASRPFNGWLSATATGVCATAAAIFAKIGRCWMPDDAYVRGWSYRKINDMIRSRQMTVESDLPARIVAVAAAASPADGALADQIVTIAARP
jgi:hypothetical protein